MKRLSGVLISLALGLICFNASADQDTKIGIVDLQKIMQTSNQMKAIQQKLEKDFKPRRDKLIAMQEGLKQDMEKFKRDSSVMSESQKKDLENKIIAKQQVFEKEGQQYQQEWSTAQNEAMEDLYGKIRKAIAKVAETNKYDIVLQKDAAPFSPDKLDITKSVIELIS